MLGQMVNVSACPKCKGEGKIVTDPCPTCHGEGRTERKRMLRVTIPAGLADGHPTPISNEGGGGGPGGPPRPPSVARPDTSHPALAAEGAGGVGVGVRPLRHGRMAGGGGSG